MKNYYINQIGIKETFMENLLYQIVSDIEEIKIRLSIPDGIVQIKNARFYLPNFPEDCIQRIMAMTQNYWDTVALDIINKYLPENAVILDIGANIGSHSVYWALEKNAKKIYAYEPLESTYKILKRNIKLNHLDKKIKAFKYGLYSTNSKASVDNFHLANIGNTSFVPSVNGNFELKKLDSIRISEKIDLIKIDVEGAEVEVLIGAKNTIKKNKPVIVIESFNNKEEIDNIFTSYGYEQIDTIRQGEDYIYKPID